MRVDGVAFESPAGLEDSTSYSYQARASYEELTIEFELPVGRATPAELVMADIHEGLAGYFAAEFSVVARGDQPFVGQLGKFLTYELDGSEPVVSKIIVANTARPDGPVGTAKGGECPKQAGDWIKLAWSGAPATLAAAGGSIDAVVDPIIASVVPIQGAGQRAPATVLPGHVRHQAGDWVLDVPAHLRGPRTFIYEDIDIELRVELTVLDDGAPEPTLEPGVAVAGGEELSRTEHALADGARVDLDVRSDSDPNGESTLILAKRKVELTGARAVTQRWVAISATSPARDGARLRSIIDDLLASVHAEEPV
jgi:hypothetical protein